MLSEAKESTDSLHVAEDLLELLPHIQERYAHHLKAFSLTHDKLEPRLVYALGWVTISDSTYKRPIKRTFHYLNLGVLRPLVCDFSDVSEDSRLWPGLRADQIRHLSFLVLAWAFMLSARCVEILTSALGVMLPLSVPLGSLTGV